MLYRFRGMSVFLTLDFDSGFHQIQLDDKSKPKTAFFLGHGHYQWKVLPMEVYDAPAYVFYTMMQTLRKLQYAI